MNYIVVSTLCNKKEIADKIIDTLLEKRLIAGAQVYESNSKYWWKDKIESDKEYLIQMRTKEYLYSKIEKEILKIHDYEVCEISYQIIAGGNKAFFNWIDGQVDKKSENI
jgi:periplasmic divalent cation tolerance protein